MVNETPDWHELEPVGSRHRHILSIFQENPDTAYTAKQIAHIVHDIDGDEDIVILTLPASTICSNLSFQGYLETRIDDSDGKMYFRLKG